LRAHLEADGITLRIGDAWRRRREARRREDSAEGIALGGPRPPDSPEPVISGRSVLVATGRRANAEAWGATGLRADGARFGLKVEPLTLEARARRRSEPRRRHGARRLHPPRHYHGQVPSRAVCGRGRQGRSHGGSSQWTFSRSGDRVGGAPGGCRARSGGIDVVVASAIPETRAATSTTSTGAHVKAWSATRERGVLIGATLVTPRAGEIVGELVLAIKLPPPLRTPRRRHPPVPGLQPRARQNVSKELATEGSAASRRRDPETTTQRWRSRCRPLNAPRKLPPPPRVDL